MFAKTEAISRVTSHFLGDAAREVLLHSPPPPALHELQRDRPVVSGARAAAVSMQSTSAKLTVMAATLCQVL